MSRVDPDPHASSAWEVPAYRLELFGIKRHRHCVVVFVLNEGERFLRQLDTMKPLADEIDIVVADGGSSDGSMNLEGLKRRGVRALLVKHDVGGLSAQMRMALSWALHEGYDGVVVIDGNGKDDVAAIPSFQRALDAGFDHVQGSRYVPGGRGINTPWLRHWGVRALHAPLITLSAGFRYTDTTNGFRAYSAALLLDPQVSPFRHIFQAYELHYYLAIRAARLGFRCTELPVTRAYPAHGPVPSKIRGLRGPLRVLLTLGRACLHRFDP